MRTNVCVNHRTVHLELECRLDTRRKREPRVRRWLLSCACVPLPAYAGTCFAGMTKGSAGMTIRSA
jgi:hypothetical protein